MVIDLLLENGYPLKLIFEKIHNRLKMLIYNKNENPTSNNSLNNSKNSSEDINRKIIVLPYINKISELIAITVDKSKCITGYNRVLNNLGRFTKAHKDTNELLTNSCNGSPLLR